jgi:ribosome-associated protein
LATTKVTKKRVRKPPAKATKTSVSKVVEQTAAPSVAPAAVTEENPTWLTAVRAAESKKAVDVCVLDLREVTSFTDFFVICSGTNIRQVQAIAEEIDIELGKRGEKATSLEGFKNGEWVLADYGDMIVHVFSPTARAFYELERLWRHAKAVEIPLAAVS